MKVKINSITLSKNILIVREQHKVSNLKESTRKMIFIIEYIVVLTAFFINCFLDCFISEKNMLSIELYNQFEYVSMIRILLICKRNGKRWTE
ncbi:hypothetical protein Ccar_06510 [Clostridium carboxidivorans P7]|uniref:Uncharacterized protein n=1 Tax=Clostridium carboxidivorans P7 TaxID=536227 RepID=C6PT90_9CLOT|nr:hypothetical protein [Clostridium carboxidivorans]AKN30495.1 hypothetical protein Ccar_06510 [Clostridium carboxidivorans P7]EET87510.1 hypothetical protein CcarbDRAFT_2007 [Clostridium carboxidivorans P7]